MQKTVGSESRIKCLFISNVPLGGIFEAGAGNSLRTFLENQEYLEVDLILPLFIGHLFHWPHIIKQAFRLRSANLRKIFFFPVPYSHCHEGAPSSFKAKFAYFINNVLATLLLPLTKKIIHRKRYRFIHLNSIVLNSLISKKAKFVIHIREVIDPNTSAINKVMTNLQKASGLIFIDRRTFTACDDIFKNSSLPCHHIINNPFDMEEARNLRKESAKILQQYGLTNFSGKIFSYMGMLHPIKGVDVIISAFLKAELEDAVLLLVGPGNKSHLRLYRSLAKPDEKRIFFLGRLNFSEVKKIYAISDFVVRGDPDFRIGRTTFEALFSGCSVIIPGSYENIMQEINLQTFKSEIFLYTPGNKSCLSEVIQKAYESNTITSLNQYVNDNNIRYHCEGFKKFLTTCKLL